MNAEELVRFAFPELFDPEPCSCDEALALRAELERARQVASDTADILGKASAERQEARDEVRALRTELARTRFLSVLRGKLGETWARMLDKERALVVEARHVISGYEMALPECANCGKPAACMGSYESDDAWAHACDECCAHGNEDGQCFPLAELPARFTGVLKRAAKAELAEAEATAREVSLAEAANQLSRELAEAKAAVEVAEKRAGDEALTHDNLLEEVESYRELFLAEQRKLAEAHAALADHEAHMLQLYAEQKDALAEAKRAAETWEELCHGQEVLAVQGDALVERFEALALDATAKMNAMEVSMNAAYTERNRLVAFVARICKPTAGIRRTAIDGWDPAWHGCVFIDTSQGQMSWHYHDSDAHLFASLPAYERPWDGHTTAEKYARLWRLTELTAALP